MNLMYKSKNKLPTEKMILDLLNGEDISEETDEDFCGWFGDMGEEDRGGR